MDVKCFYKGKKRSDLEGGKLERAGLVSYTLASREICVFDSSYILHSCTLGPPPVPSPTSATPERNATKILKAEKR